MTRDKMNSQHSHPEIGIMCMQERYYSNDNGWGTAQCQMRMYESSTRLDWFVGGSSASIKREQQVKQMERRSQDRQRSKRYTLNTLQVRDLLASKGRKKCGHYLTGRAARPSSSISGMLLYDGTVWRVYILHMDEDCGHRPAKLMLDDAMGRERWTWGWKYEAAYQYHCRACRPYLRW